jgi:hypothetical protein
MDGTEAVVSVQAQAETIAPRHEESEDDGLTLYFFLAVQEESTF